MALLLDLVKQATLTIGTGNIALGVKVSGFTEITDHPAVVNGTELNLTIIDGTNKETGIYTWNTGNTLTRTDIRATLTAGVYDDTSPTALALSGSALVVGAVNKAAFEVPHPFRGALLSKSTDQTGIVSNTWTAFSFDTESYDTSVFHDNATNNSRITIPADVSKVRLTSNADLTGTSVTTVQVEWYKNGAIFLPSGRKDGTIISDQSIVNMHSAVLDVVVTDYFELMGRIVGSSGLTFKSSNSTWFALEVLE